MLRRLLVALAAVTATSLGAPAAASPHKTTEMAPTYHYTPATNFTNDAYGLIRYRGVYQLFYQHNPAGNTAGDGSWATPPAPTW